MFARTFLRQQFLQLRHLRHFLAINSHNHVAFLDASSFGRTAFDHFGHINSFVGTQVNLFLLFLLCVDVVQHIAAADAQHSTLYGAILLEVFHHFGHDGCGNSETVATVSARLRIEHGIDAYQFALRINQGTARVTGIDGRIGLNEARNLRTVAAVAAHGACLGTHDACCDSGAEVVGVAHSQHPFAHLQFVAVANGKRGQVLTVDFDER